MSLSNPNLKNPAVRFMQWRGGEDGGGRVTWYDKEAEEEKEMQLPMRFTVLDELNTVTGYSEKARSGFWSNEVRNLTTDELIVRTKDGIVARGTWGKIGDNVKSKGAKFAKSVYIAFKDEEGELVIGNMKIAGAAMTAWIDFQKKFDVAECAVMITDKPKKAKKGSTTYFVPKFEGLNLATATLKAALELDKVLQKYLGSYLTRKPDLDDDELEEVDDDVEIEDVEPTAEAPKKKTAKKAEPVEEDDDDEEETIDLKDVPF